MWGVAECSPPARGWTAILEGLPPVEVVFPACAGMDRSPRTSAVTRASAPRLRGDGPAGVSPKSRRTSCSPPTRGWTANTREPSTDQLVSPAYAGMDRVQPPDDLDPQSVPRLRGDGPSRVASVFRVRSCSPPARGWTDVLGQTGHRSGVFPACAGMDRKHPGTCSGVASVPRLRGDGPGLRGLLMLVRVCSPPARGWTGEVLDRVQQGRCSPPTRGWTGVRYGRPVYPVVFPTCAGMDRAVFCPSSASIGIPRLRGDGPPWRPT